MCAGYAETKFGWLSEFDRALMTHLSDNNLPAAEQAEAIWLDEQKNLMLYRRADHIYAINWHPTRSQEHVFLYCGDDTDQWHVTMSTDDHQFGGWGRIAHDPVYSTADTPHGRGFFIYLPARSALVLERANEEA